jgi:heme exporter protein C
MRQSWWKIGAVIFLIYVIIGGFLFPSIDDLGILGKTVRNLHFHVPMWFTMLVLLGTAYVSDIKYLRSGDLSQDSKSSSFIKVAILFGIMGLVTGSIWARFTWGFWWIKDPKLNGAAIGVIIYFAYYILRNSIEDENSRAKFSSVYNLFAFPLFIVLILIYPKMMVHASNHPGTADTMAFSEFKPSNWDLRMVFYPAVIGWISLGVWISTLRYRITELRRKDEEI